MALFSFVMFFVVIVLIGVGFAIGLVACVCGAVLLGFGVISSSIFVGLRSGRTAMAIRVFLLQCGLILGVPAGAVCAWIGQSFFESYGGGWPVLIYGAIGGALAGLIVALLLDFISRHLHSWATDRIRLRSGA